MAADVHSLVAPYALDALDEGEEREFEQHLAICEPCRRELAGLREAAAALAYSAPPATPPPELKERILEQARSERSNVVPIRRDRRLPFAAAGAVAVAAVAALAIWVALPSGNGNQFTSVLSQPGARFFPMGRSGGVAVAPNGEAALALAVPPAPSGKTYQAWVIRSGNAQPAGLFPGQAGTSVVRLSRPVGNRDVVAVTLERSGGVPKPTTKPLAMSGRVT